MAVSQLGVLDVTLGVNTCPAGYTDLGQNLQEECSHEGHTNLRSCVKMGKAETGIQDVTVVAGNGAACPAGYEYMKYPGESGGHDLNKGCRGEYLYPCVKRGNAPFLSGLALVRNSTVSPGSGYRKLDVELKQGTGRPRPDLWWWMLDGPALAETCNSDPSNLNSQTCKDYCLSNPGACDGNVLRYCAANPTDTDFCGCENTDEYNKFKSHLKANNLAWDPYCFATQCKSSSAYKTASMVHGCDIQVCIQNVDLDVDSSKLGNVTSTCNLTRSSNTSSDSTSSDSTSSGNSGSITSPTNGPTTTAGFSTQKKVGIGLSVLCALILLSIFAGLGYFLLK